ncbi:cupin domain-containing protein [Candidatus Sumerlaeota bacterium]|nr:cupin domain-containing protein [Candidatus Sumerlaeota bacterium]
MGKDRGYEIAQMEEVTAVQSTCGTSRRAFISPDNKAISIHLLDLRAEPALHYHKQTTEVYYILEGNGAVELNGEDVAVRPGTAVMIKPGTFHRGKGKLRLLVICTPAYTKSDEFFE